MPPIGGGGAPPPPPAPPPPALPSSAPPPVVVVALPPTIPPSWLSDIRSAIQADRPSAVLTLLGSAVLAAVIGAGSSILSAWVTARAAEDLEIRKSQLELARAEITESVRSYDNLEKRLMELREGYAGVAAFIRVAGPSVNRRGDTARMRAEISRIGMKEGEVLALKSDLHLDQDTWAQLDKVINEVAQSISDSDTDLARFADRSDAIAMDLNSSIAKVQAKKAEQSARLSATIHP